MSETAAHPFSVSTLRRLTSDVPLLSEGALLAFLHLAAGGMRAAEHPGLSQFRAKLRPTIERVGDLAIVPIHGALARRPDPWEMAFGDVEDVDAVRDLVNTTAADPAISGILLDIDSPGGYHNGGPELADAVRRAGASKPVAAWSGGVMASLAYWVGSQAEQVIAGVSASVGSIGAYIAILDVSKLYDAVGVKVQVFTNKEGTLKGAGMAGTSLTDDQKAHFQERAQACFDDFRRSVLSVRPDIAEGAMQGQTIMGPSAKRAGLVDRVGDRSFAIQALRGMVRKRNAA